MMHYLLLGVGCQNLCLRNVSCLELHSLIIGTSPYSTLVLKVSYAIAIPNLSLRPFRASAEILVLSHPWCTAPSFPSRLSVNELLAHLSPQLGPPRGQTPRPGTFIRPGSSRAGSLSLYLCLCPSWDRRLVPEVLFSALVFRVSLCSWATEEILDK